MRSILKSEACWIKKLIDKKESQLLSEHQVDQRCHYSMDPPRYIWMSLFYVLPKIHKDVIVLCTPQDTQGCHCSWTPQDTQGCHCSMYSPRYTRMSLFYVLPKIPKDVIVHGLPKIHKDVIVLWTPPRYTRMSLFYGLPKIHKDVIVHGLPKIHKDVIVQWNPHDTQGCHCSMDSP